MFKLSMVLVIASISFAGHLVGWGSDNHGQVSSMPTGEDFIEVECGHGHAIAIKSDGTLEAWGRNGDDQGEIPSYLEGETFTDIAAGAQHNVAIKSDGTLEAWGLNDDDQCICPDGIFIDVAAGERHSTGLRSDGTVETWGYTPMEVHNPTGVTGFISISSSDSRAVALRFLPPENTCIFMWNPSDYKQLYDFNKFTEVASSDDFTCGIDSLSAGNFSVREWSYDDNQWVDNGQPYQPGNYHGLTRSETHGFVIEDGELIGWGSSSSGALDVPSPNAGYLNISAGFSFSIGIQETGTGISEPSVPTINLSVLANPSASPVIQFTADAAAELSIYDISGRTISSESYDAGEHSVSPMISTGIYFVRLSSANSEILGRLSVLH